MASPRNISFIPEAKQREFCALLDKVDRRSLRPERYEDRYLLHLLAHRRYYVRIYARVLDLALLARTGNKDILLVDYGSGNGLLGLLACFCGVQRVVAVDRDAAFIEASVRLRDQLSLKALETVAGDIDQLAAFLGDAKPDVMVGTDVIEHIYELDSFFTMVRQLGSDMNTVFTTASNPCNPFKRRELRKIHWADEYFGDSQDDPSLNNHSPSRAFLEVRKEIIRAKGLIDEDKVTLMAARTRGMDKQDIEKAVSRYLNEGIMPAPPSHPTNTCDPITGSWSERLLELEDYEKLYRDQGYSLEVLDGFYDDDKRGPRKWIARFLNTCIPISGHRLSPFIILCGRGPSC